MLRPILYRHCPENELINEQRSEWPVDVVRLGSDNRYDMRQAPLRLRRPRPRRNRVLNRTDAPPDVLVGQSEPFHLESTEAGRDKEK